MMTEQHVLGQNKRARRIPARRATGSGWYSSLLHTLRIRLLTALLVAAALAVGGVAQQVARHRRAEGHQHQVATAMGLALSRRGMSPSFLSQPRGLGTSPPGQMAISGLRMMGASDA